MIVLQNDGSIVISAAGVKVNANTKIVGNLEVTGSITSDSGPITSDGLVLDTHEHIGVRAGSDKSGGPINA
jgi:phage baseplate assembly protein gpV